MDKKEICVDVVTLKNDVSYIKNELNCIMVNVNEIKVAIGKLNEDWQGDAETGFVAALENDIQFLVKAEKTIKRTTDDIDVIVDLYYRCNLKNLDVISELNKLRKI